MPLGRPCTLLPAHDDSEKACNARLTHGPQPIIRKAQALSDVFGCEHGPGLDSVLGVCPLN